MKIRYAADLPQAIIGLIENNKQLLTQIQHLTGPYRSHRLDICKPYGFDAQWSLSTDDRTQVIPSLENALEDFIISNKTDPVIHGGQIVFTPLTSVQLLVDKTKKDKQYEIMVGLLVTLLSVLHIEDEISLVISLIWSENGGLLFIDRYRDGVDTNPAMSHPYIRASWNEDFFRLVPTDEPFSDSEGTDFWMNQFHKYMQRLMVNYAITYIHGACWIVQVTDGDEDYNGSIQGSIGANTADVLYWIAKIRRCDAILNDCKFVTIHHNDC